MSGSRAGPVPSRTAARSMITVTNFSPRRVWRHTCSSTPIAVTPSKRFSSLISTRLPSARTASLAVFHATRVPRRPGSWCRVVRHHNNSDGTTGPARGPGMASTARSGLSCWPVAARPSSSSRQNLVRSGQATVASDKSRSANLEDLDFHPGKAVQKRSRRPMSCHRRSGLLRVANQIGQRRTRSRR